MAFSPWGVTFILGLAFLSAGGFVRSEEFTAPSKQVKYRESYIIRYQNATCKCSGGKLVLLGPNDPIALTASGNFQVFTSAVSSGPNQPLQMWKQMLITEPSGYKIQQSGNSVACITADGDSEPGGILALDVCQSVPATPQVFNYQVVRDNLPGCKRSNRNGWAVQIFATAAFDICFSAPKTPGAHATLEVCNAQDENQLFFINVPSIRRG